MTSIPENLGKLQAGASKMIVSLSIALIIFIVLLIVAGRILNLINNSKCHTSNDPDIQTAHKWAAWSVGITTLGMIVCLVFLGILIAGMVA
jgi:hypothetical protein